MVQIDFTPPKRRIKIKVGQSWNWRFTLLTQTGGQPISLQNVSIYANVILSGETVESFSLGNGILKSTDNLFFYIKKNWTTISFQNDEVQYNPPIKDLPIGILIVQLIIVDSDNLIFYPLELEVEVVPEATDSTERDIPESLQQIIIQDGFSVGINTIAASASAALTVTNNKLYFTVEGQAPQQVFDFGTLEAQITSQNISNPTDFQNFVTNNPNYEGIVRIENDNPDGSPNLIYRYGGKNYIVLIQELETPN